MGQIQIKRMQFYTFNGVLPEENKLGQRLELDAQFKVPFEQLGTQDDLAQTVSYAEVYDTIAAIVQQHQFKLIESLVNLIAQSLLAQFPLMQQVTLDLRKYGAPIAGIMDYVGVHTTLVRHQVYLSIGANLGEPQVALKKAVQALAATPTIHVTAVSHFYRTAPVGGVVQPDFYNQAVALTTTLDPEALLTRLQAIEQAGQRQRKVHWGPRTIDLDILMYDQQQINTTTLTIPHPEMSRRAFVLAPMVEITTGPLQQRCQTWLQALGTSQRIEKIEGDQA